MSDLPPPGSRAVFLSYAREDAEAARRIADALRAFGIEVWFDQNELRGGDSWDQKIRGQIRGCALLIPIVSAHTQARHEGYFRREWKLAVERTYDMASGVAFIVPVVIDETKEADALVPDEFMRFQWTRLAHGVPTPQFVEQVKRMVEKPQRPAAAGTHSAAPQPAAKKGPPVALLISLATVFVAVGVVFFVTSRKDAPPPAATPDAKSQTLNPAAPVPRLADKSIAVLPFANMSEDKDNAFFADGIHEDILTNLALVRELRVVSRTSVMPYRKTDGKSMKQIAQELGVTYILEGSVRRSGNKVRVTGQLIHAASDEHVWAASYDRDLTDIFTIQAELSQQIAGALKAALSPEEKVLIARKPTENPAAYDAFLRARDEINRFGNSQGPRSRQIAHLERAVELDPNFAQAWGELASACAYWSFSSYEGMEEKLARAKVAIERAVKLSPDDPDVFSSLGTYYYYGFRDYSRAAEQYERRARLQPNSPIVFNSLGLILRRQGKWPQSLANSRRACELDPANIAYQRNLLATLRAARRWDEYLEVQRRLATLLPNSLEEAFRVAYVPFLATGSMREANAFLAGLTPEQRDSPEGIFLRTAWAATIGDHAEAIRLDRIQPYYEGEGSPEWEQGYFAALSYVAVNDKAGAIARLGDSPVELRKMVEREPKNYRYWNFLAAMEILLGNRDEALRCLARAQELFPESRDALDGVSYAMNHVYLYDQLGDKERALAGYIRLANVPRAVIGNVHEWRYSASCLRGDPRWEALLSDPANNAPLF